MDVSDAIKVVRKSHVGMLREHNEDSVASDLSIGLVVLADQMLIKLVMQEMLGNAWKFTSQRSQTEISFGMLPPCAETPGAEPAYVVRDNGEGFDMAHANKLFRSFNRLHAAHEFPGAGIGLANIHKTEPLMGGCKIFYLFGVIQL